jgi:hypothetical protein
MKMNHLFFETVPDFEQFYNEYLDRTNPTRLRIKPAPTKFKLTKLKEVKPREEVVEADQNGLPRVRVVAEKVTKEVPDTNGFTKLIIAYIQSVYRCESVRRISSEGRWRPNKNSPKGGTWLPGQNNGIEDIQAVINGRLVAIEVKFTKSDKMRPEQIKRMNQIIADGGVYLQARNFGQIQIELMEAVQPIPTSITKNGKTINHIGQAYLRQGGVLYVFRDASGAEYRLSRERVLEALKTADNVEYLPNVNI